MSRTNIEIDDELIARVMERYEFRTKREAVDSALRTLDVEPLAREELLALEGMGWGDDTSASREDAPVVKSWTGRDPS